MAGVGNRPSVSRGHRSGTLVSSLLKELSESAGDIEFGEGREVELKGLAGSHRLHEVRWQD